MMMLPVHFLMVRGEEETASSFVFAWGEAPSMLESEEGGQLPVGHRVRSSQRQKFFYPSSISLLFHTRFKSIFCAPTTGYSLRMMPYNE